MALGCSVALTATGVQGAAASPPPYPSLYLVPADGSSAPAELGMAKWSSSFSWSPDGAALVTGTEYFGIRVMSFADGWRDLTDDYADSDPAWSPDGERILFVRAEWGADAGLFVAAADGGEAVPFADAPGAELAPAWSPDGSAVAYYHRPPGSDGVTELRISPSDGTSHRVVATGAIEMLSPPEWDPTGASLAFTMAGPDGSRDVYAATVDGSTLHLVAGGDGDQRAPDWSPDGSRIAFAGLEGILVTDAAGSTPPLVLAEGGRNPAWSPEGDRIAFDDGYDIMTIRADGTDEQTVVAEPWQPAHSPDWSPTGHSIAFVAGWLDARNACDGIERNTVKPLYEGSLFSGDDGDDRLKGSAERDLFCSFDGDDRVGGGGGHDTVWADEGDDLVRGGGGADYLQGDGTGDHYGPRPEGNDVLYGGYGRDFVNGGPGDDVLRGGPGRDRIRGGSGHDVCYVRRRDRVRDCEVVRTRGG